MKNGRILVVVAEMGHNSQREIVGIRRAAKRIGLAVDVVECRHFGDGPDFAKLIDFWRPGGLIIDPEYAREAQADKAARALPLVVWDAAQAGGDQPRCALAMSDPEAIAAAAARELAATGFRRFIFVPALGAPRWSVERGAAFAKVVTSLDLRFRAFEPSAGETGDAGRFRSGLLRFLSARKTPCGVFAANDATAAIVANSCAELGLRVPQDVAIVGVDDSPEYCEGSEPTITSVRIDLEEGGAKAAEMLADMMGRFNTDARKRVPPAPHLALYSVERVVRRESTQVLKCIDGRVSRALEWIRRNACSPISAADVVDVMGCSRRMADLSFRRAVGRSILDEIHARRLDEARALLKRDDVPIEEIPTRLGYDRGPFLGILFRRTFGCSMREWRKKNRL